MNKEIVERLMEMVNDRYPVEVTLIDINPRTGVKFESEKFPHWREYTNYFIRLKIAHNWEHLTISETELQMYRKTKRDKKIKQILQ
jgi:hypothetical protein